MDRRPLLLTSGVLVLALTAAPACTKEATGGADSAVPYVLPGGQEQTIASMLALSRPLGGDVQLNARVEGDRVLVFSGPEGQWRFAVTLVHESEARPDARVVAGLALLEEPGPAPGPLVDELMERIGDSGLTLAWTRMEPSGRGPSSGDAPWKPFAAVGLLLVLLVVISLEVRLFLADRKHAPPPEAPPKRRPRQRLLAATYVGLVVVYAGLCARAASPEGGVSLVAAALYALTFALAAVVVETRGARSARRLVWIGAVAQLVLLAVVWALVANAPAYYWTERARDVRLELALIPHALAAALVAFAVSQLHHIWLAALLRRRMDGRRLALRSALSSMLSQGLDLAVFLAVAYGASAAPARLLEILAVGLGLRVALASLAAPLVRALVTLVSRRAA